MHITFADESTFSLGENGTMALNELVYDPASGMGEAAFSVAKGVFVFVSGMIAKTTPDAMVVNTPTTTIGVRGTKVAGEVDAEGGETVVTLLREDDGQTGEIVLINDGGVRVINQAFQTVRVESFAEAPSLPELISEADLKALYGDDIEALIEGPRGDGEDDHAEIDGVRGVRDRGWTHPRPPGHRCRQCLPRGRIACARMGFPARRRTGRPGRGSH